MLQGTVGDWSAGEAQPEVDAIKIRLVGGVDREGVSIAVSQYCIFVEQNILRVRRL